MKRLLLLSNSTLPGKPFLGWPEKHIKDFLGKEKRKILFFPFAGVTFSFDAYFEKVALRLSEFGYETTSAHRVGDKVKAIAECDTIAVGGGNTFQLINYLQDGWVDLIREKVSSGTPYIGWSAGSNVACPSIKTTNDMPIIEPRSFEALDLVPFQINPHYTEASIPDHGGETRPLRIREFLEVNPKARVLGVSEGSLIRVEGHDVTFEGKGILSVFEQGKDIHTISAGSKLTFS